jgi:hypothetical protein
MATTAANASNACSFVGRNTNERRFEHFPSRGGERQIVIVPAPALGINDLATGVTDFPGLNAISGGEFDLGLSEVTVKPDRANVMRKMQATSILGVVAPIHT